MAVQRQSSILLPLSRVLVAQVVRGVFQKNQLYKDTVELKQNFLFKTNVYPNLLMLGTDMYVSLEETDAGTLVKVETKSQTYVMGDVFNFYNRYIQDFLRNLEFETHRSNALNTSQIGRTVHEEPFNYASKQANIIDVCLEPELEIIQANVEEVRIPVGVSITVKRSRTIEHAVEIDRKVSGGANTDVGLKQILSASIRGEIEKRQGYSYQESETIEYEIELSGEKNNLYRLIWTDVWRKGYVKLQDEAFEKLPFRFRERAELEVLPIDSENSM